MRFELYTDAALVRSPRRHGLVLWRARDIPEHRLRRGDVVKLVDYHRSPNGEAGYSIEVFNPESIRGHRRSHRRSRIRFGISAQG